MEETENWGRKICSIVLLEQLTRNSLGHKKPYVARFFFRVVLTNSLENWPRVQLDPWNYCSSDFKAKKSWVDCLTWNKIKNCQIAEKCLENFVKITHFISQKNPSKLWLSYHINIIEKSVKITTLISRKKSVKLTTLKFFGLLLNIVIWRKKIQF